MDFADRSVSRRQHVEALVILGALVLMAYANSFGSGFVVDGRPLILESPRVHSVTGQHLKEILLHNYSWPAFNGGLYRPLTTLSYLLNYTILGDADEPLGYHWFNYLVHVANAFLAYLLVLRLARRYGLALFAAALWALHPVCTEAVTNIAGRPEELAALGVLGALVLYVYDSREAGTGNILRRAALLVAAAVAVFSKESGVIVLALAVLYDFTWRARPGASLPELAADFRRFFWRGYVYLVLPLVAMLSVRWLALRNDGAMEIQFVDNPISGAGFAVGRVTALSVIGRYFCLLVWPGTLSCDYSYNQIPLFQRHSMTWQQGSFLAAAVGLMLTAAFCYRHSRMGFFLLGFSALALLPAANLLVPTGTIMAERLLYLPAVGFAAAVSLGIHRIARGLGLRPLAATLALGAIGAAYAARTYQRNPAWKDGETLYVSAAEAVPDAVRPHLSLAQDWYTLDPTFLQGDRAIAQAETAEKIVSGLPDRDSPAIVPAVLARLYLARGDLVAAKDAYGNPEADAASAEWYNKALEAGLRAVPVDRAFDRNHRLRELARGKRADEIAPAGIPEIYANLGRAYLRLGDPRKALQAFLYLPRLAPGASLTYSLIASAYLAQNRMEEAGTALLESALLDESEVRLARAAQLYGKIEGGSCAIAARQGRLSLNRDCAIVQRDLCSAYRGLEQAAREANQPAQADRFLEAVRDAPGCR
jgi:tetratricopeptide (TPR) repeat protein